MRSLVILRGSPGSGKSTWIKNMGLENYCLSADNLRLLFESPKLDLEKDSKYINQRNDSYVWELLFELLEKRMMQGEFVIIDATHSKQSDFSKYNNLCERYRYRKYYVSFADVPIEICKKRNQERENYKRVPDSIIEKMYSRLKTQSKTSGWVEINKDNFWNEIGMKLFDFNEYETIHVFGDIHGCYEPLKEYFVKFPYKENDMYIFCGDYLDRGIQNKETLEFLMEFSKNKNVLLLEGNHERWLNYYSLDEIENIKSKTFLNKTIPEIIDIDKKNIREFYRKIEQIAYFKFDNKKYIVTHGGISYIPNELQLISTSQYINGIGDYNVNIDEIFAKNSEDVIQIHGHRNTYDIDNINNMSFNLEGKVEFGENLKVLQLNHDQEPIVLKIKNNVFGKLEEINEFKECRTKINNNLSILEQLQNSIDIKENKLENNISSFNFTRKAFYNKKWNELTCKSRGLFVDTVKEKVVARGYEKFFNINEVQETKFEHLLVKFKNKHITCFKKENGFLGILSFVNNELFFASKSTNTGDYVEYFKTIFNNSKIKREELINYLKEHDVTLLFEVIDVENDPHIIEYPQSKIVLLDIVHNDFEFYKEPYEKVKELAEIINCECKTIYKEFDNIKDFHRWYIDNTDEDDLSKNDIEGVVIECDNFMTKLKFPYYKFWKFMRKLAEMIKNKRKINLSSLYNAEANYFYSWLKEQNENILNKDIISLRNLYFKEKNKNEK